MNTRTTNNTVSVNHGGMWIEGNLYAWNEYFRCQALAPHNPSCAERAKEIRSALESVGYFNRETA
jgi:hypothetical protein